MNKKIQFFFMFFLVAMLSEQTTLGQTESDVIGRASIHPSIVTLETGQETNFKVVHKATYLNPAKVADNVEWSVNGLVGGNSEFGTIDENGLYTAPLHIPTPFVINIMGKSEGVQNSKLYATVVIQTDKQCYESLYQHGESLEDSKYFDRPHGIALDNNGNLIIVDENKNHAIRFSPTGEFLGYIGNGPGQNDGQFTKPRVALLSQNDELYISDQKVFGNRIQIFTHDGEFKRSFGQRGNIPGRLLRVHGMDFDSGGNLYTVDIDNSRVDKFSLDGKHIKSWGKDGINKSDFNAPHGLVVDPNDDVFVQGYYGTIQKFDADGNYLFSFAHANPPDGSVFIHAISEDKWGNIYAMVRGIRGAEAVIERTEIFGIEKFNNNGDFICGIRLSVEAHSETWAVVDNNGYLYSLFRSVSTAGFEVFAPQ